MSVLVSCEKGSVFLGHYPGKKHSLTNERIENLNR